MCWPLSAYLVEHFGWRGACAVYAAIQVFVSLPLHVFVLPGIHTPTPETESPKETGTDSAAPGLTGDRRMRGNRLFEHRA